MHAVLWHPYRVHRGTQILFSIHVAVLVNNQQCGLAELGRRLSTPLSPQLREALFDNKTQCLLLCRGAFLSGNWCSGKKEGTSLVNTAEGHDRSGRVVGKYPLLATEFLREPSAAYPVRVFHPKTTRCLRCPLVGFSPPSGAIF